MGGSKPGHVTNTAYRESLSVEFIEKGLEEREGREQDSGGGRGERQKQRERDRKERDRKLPLQRKGQKGREWE